MARAATVNKLFLLTKTDIPFNEAQVIIHQPSIKELSLIGETALLTSCDAITRNYKALNIDGVEELDKLSNFEIFMLIINQKTEQNKFIRECISKLLFLIFPIYKPAITPRALILQEHCDDGKNIMHMIDVTNFDIFSNIIWDMFCMAELKGQSKEYNPAGDRAKAIIAKIEEGRRKREKLRGKEGSNETKSIFARYMSVLAVGEHKDLNELAEYSMYQLFEEFKRFQMKEEFDYTFQAKLAGATNMKDADDWMDDIQPGSRKKEIQGDDKALTIA